MRIRGLILTGTFLLTPVAALTTTASVAHAAPTRGAAAEGHLRHCLEKAIEEVKADSDLPTAVEECHESKSPVFPATAELLWGGVAWAIVAGLLMKVGFPAIKKTLKDREDKIRGDLEAAERSRTDASAEADRYRAQIANAGGEAAGIIEEARQGAERVRADVLARAEAEAAGIRARAQSDVQMQSERALDELRSQVSKLSIDLAEKIVEHNLDSATQLALIENYINQVGTN